MELLLLKKIKCNVILLHHHVFLKELLLQELGSGIS